MSGRLRNGYGNRGANRATVILFTGALVLLLLSGALTTVMVRRGMERPEGTATPAPPTTVAVAPTATPGAAPSAAASAAASVAPSSPAASVAASAVVTVTATTRPASPTAAGTPATPGRPGSPAASASAAASGRPSGAPSAGASPRPSAAGGSPVPAASSLPAPTAVMGGCGFVLPAGFVEERPGYYPAANRRGFIALDPFETNGGRRTATEIAQQFVDGTLQQVLQNVRQTATTRTDEGVRVEYTASAGGQPGRGVVVVRSVGEIACGVTYFVLNGTTTQFEQTLDAVLASLQPIRAGKE